MNACADCGQPFEAVVSDEDCEMVWTGGHELPVCPGCGDEAATADDLPAHRRCHLIP